MEPIRLKEIVEAIDCEPININAQQLENLFITDVCIDSRKVKNGSLFVAIEGENVDGHNYIKKSFEGGAVCALTEKKKKDIIGNNIVLYTKNTIKAVGQLAKYYCSKFNALDVIEVTGSVGKTTTKDMIASVLDQIYPTLKTQGNYNNEIGLPLTLFGLNKSMSKAVLELGMSQFGEIKYLTSIVKPCCATVITNIGVSHMENLGSREGILKAKCEIFDNMRDDAIAVLNADDDMLITLKDKLKHKVIWFGIKNNIGIYATNIISLGLNGTKCTIHSNDDIFDIYIKSPGKHIIYAALIATAIGNHFGMSKEDIKKGIENFEPSKMRMNISKCKNSITIINDTYNASPQSMKAALDVLKDCTGNRKVAILGDMYEIGEMSNKMHTEIGEYAANIGTDVIICVGDLGKCIYYGAYSNKRDSQIVLYFKNQTDLHNKLLDIVNKYDIILLKASRSMNLEKTVDKIEEVEF